MSDLNLMLSEIYNGDGEADVWFGEADAFWQGICW
jgi:hypothetical protein